MLSTHLWGGGLTALALCLALMAPAALAENGTALTINATADVQPCDNNCTATITAAATTSGSTAPAAILVSTDGNVTFTNVGTVATGEWAGSGRFKTSPEEQIAVTGLPGGGVSTVVTVCFLQPGANGNPLKKACTDLTIAPPPTNSCGPISMPGCL